MAQTDLARVHRSSKWALLVAAATACSADDPVDVPLDGMSATVDGSAWTAAEVASTINNEFVFVTGINAAQVSLGIGFPYQGPGAYEIGPEGGGLGLVYDGESGWFADVEAGSGSIIVGSLDETGASGTFTFSAPLAVGTGASAMRVVTDGAFRVRY